MPTTDTERLVAVLAYTPGSLRVLEAIAQVYPDLCVLGASGQIKRNVSLPYLIRQVEEAQRTARVQFVVSIAQPEGVTRNALRDYILDAVSTWSGQFKPPGGISTPNSPGDLLWGIGKTTSVKELTHE